MLAQGTPGQRSGPEHECPGRREDKGSVGESAPGLVVEGSLRVDGPLDYGGVVDRKVGASRVLVVVSAADLTAGSLWTPFGGGTQQRCGPLSVVGETI